MKILVVRFSSIGDIVLTTPVIRCIKQQIPEAEVHYLTKQSFYSVIENNPHLDKIHTVEKSIKEIVPVLLQENYDYIVDLHNNIRTFSLKRKLHVTSFSFPKLHIEKWLLVNFKIEMQTKVHVVDRYFEAVKSLGVINDLAPCDFYIDAANEVDLTEYGLQKNRYIGFAIGAQYATKRMPVEKMKEILSEISDPVVLLGGTMDMDTANQLVIKESVLNFCGKFNLQQSASIVRQAGVLLTHDTGLMHIASAFQIPIVSVWGNTVPALGMYPYYPEHPERFSIHEVKGLKCRPCSKIGFQECPKKHFRCMKEQNAAAIIRDVETRLRKE